MKKFFEHIVEGMLKLSGAFTSIVILLIIIFLFKEGFGLFKSPSLEKGYELVVSSGNTIQHLTPMEVKSIYDGDVTNWKQLKGADEEITPLRIDDVFDRYTEDELGENYEHLSSKIDEMLAQEPGDILCLPQQYVPKSGCKKVSVDNVTPGSFFFGKEWFPTATPAALFGTLSLLLGTLLVSLVAIAIATPVGIAVSIYLAELASERMHKVLKPIIELLAGIPSIVYGFFGLVVIVPLIQHTFGLPVGETGLAGAIVLAIMTLPTIITVGEDAIRTTPRAMKEASLGLGANHWQTIYKVVLPYSLSGLMAAVVLGIGRAIGETMAVLMVTGNAALMPTSLLQPCRTIPATIAAELGETSAGSAHYQSLFLLGSVLFVITLLISVAVELISAKQQKER
jgi:phosphate transport system permease protein